MRIASIPADPSAANWGRDARPFADWFTKSSDIGVIIDHKRDPLSYPPQFSLLYPTYTTSGRSLIRRSFLEAGQDLYCMTETARVVPQPAHQCPE